MNSVLTTIVFVFLATSYPVETKDDDETKYLDKFAAWHCYQRMTCTKGGGWVCGVDRTKGFIMASFPDKCYLHGVNCRKQGVYKQISTEKCDPTILFLKMIVKDYGQPNFVYSTLPYDHKEPDLDELSLEDFETRKHKKDYSPERFVLHRKRTKIRAVTILNILNSLGIFANMSMNY